MEEESLNEELNKIYSSIRAVIDPSGDNYDVWVYELYETYAIICKDSKYYKVPYLINSDGVATLGDWTEIERVWQPVEKSLWKSARITSDDLVFGNSKLKSLGNGKFGGYLITFSDPKSTDLEGDFFTKDTDLGVENGNTVPLYYHHGMDGVLKTSKIGKGTAKFDDAGLWYEAQLEMRKDYEDYVEQMISDGKLGLSSGAAGHLVEREQIGKAWHIKSWPIAEASLTPTPAEPRNSVMPLKSLIQESAQTVHEAEAVEPAQSEQIEAARIETEPNKEQKTMEPDEIKKLIDEAAAKAVEEFKKLAPAPDLSGLSVVHDEADTPFKNLSAQCKAVRELETVGKMHPRLKALRELATKANGATEAVPSEGGYLLDPSISAELLKPVHENGVFTSKARKIPVGANSNSGWINGVDETSRATGSRWGGIQGYRLAEGGTPTGTKPKFRRINWELKKYAVLCYATDELLSDAAQFEMVVREGAMEELNFMANDDILNGSGAGGPLGVMNSPAKIAVTRDTASYVLHNDIVAMWARMHPRFKANAAWYINAEVQPHLDKLYFTGTTSVLSPMVGYRPDGVMTLYGKPVIETEFNAALNTTGDILLADFGQYLYFDKTAQAASSMHVAFVTDEQVFRFIYRCDGQTVDAAPITPYKGTSTKSAFVVLGSASA